MTPDYGFLKELGIQGSNSGAFAGRWLTCTGPTLDSTNPATGERIARVEQASKAEYEACMQAASQAWLRWRLVPAPRRGEIVRRMGERMREKKDALGKLITLETGKLLQEGWGEVQEAIDIADFAVGQSRMLYGLSMHSERALHSMREQWHPLGVVGIVTAFNFPMAVWAWNSMLALVCGDACLWKPSESAPLCAIALTNVIRPVLEAEGLAGLCSLCIGGVDDVARPLIMDSRIPLVSFTGSTAVGRDVAARVAGRLGRSILELGGNNAVVVMPDADLEMVVRSTLFGAVGTAGQRCTTTRRLLVHERVAEQVLERLLRAYQRVKVGDPMEEGTLCGPLIKPQAVAAMLDTLERAKAQGGKVLCGGTKAQLKGRLERGNFVVPAIVRMGAQTECVREETFAPILYVLTFQNMDEALRLHNEVPQGLSSAIFTLSVRDAERFMSAAGSDCGIANANIGTSGAEIGGAFGGEKDTGGGRESGSDSWKAYMRRQTNTVNWGTELPLAQGIQFG